MRVMLLAASLLITATATAQTGQSGVGVIIGLNGNLNRTDFIGDRSRFVNGNPASTSDAEAWARCVVRADQGAVRALLGATGVARSRIRYRLQPAFFNCANDVGARPLFVRYALQTPALADALRSS